MKGFADVADKELFSAALLTQVHPKESSLTRQYSDQSTEPPEDSTEATVKRKRQRHSSSSSQSKSSSYEQTSPHSPQSKREQFQTSREGTASSFR